MLGRLVALTSSVSGPGWRADPPPGVAVPGAGDDAALASVHVAQPVRLAGRVRIGIGEAAAVRGDRLLGVFSQVVPQVPAVSDLDRGRRAGPGALGVGPGPVPA